MSLSNTILVVGSANVDLIMKVKKVPRLGETVTGGVFSQVFGGKGANQAVGAARAGGRVTFLGCVGQDDYAAGIIESMQRDGINMSRVRQVAGIATGTALIMIDEDGHNLISVAPGANYRLTPDHIDDAEEIFQDAGIIVLQCELHPDTLDYVLERGAALGRSVLLNLAPARPLSDAQLANLEWLVVNETEAAFLTGTEVNDEGSARRVIRSLDEKVKGGVIITLGAAGSLVSRDGRIFHVPAFPVKAEDTTAAGDVYCGALATALIEGKGVEDAVRFASAAAAISVTRMGAQPSAPRREEIDHLLRVG